MQFNISERLLLLAIIPRQGDITTLRIVKELTNELSFSEEEHKNLNLRTENGLVHWNAANDFGKEVLFGDVAVKLVCSALADLEGRKSLGLEYLDLYDRFMQEKEKREKIKM